MKKIILIGIGVTILVVIGFLVLMVYTIQPINEVEEELQIVEPTIFVTKNLEELLPTREEVGTTWNISETNLESYKEFGNTERTGKRFSKGTSFDITTVVTNLWKYDSEENVKKQFDKIIAELIEIGGYEEVKVNAPDATCYGTYIEIGTSEENYSYRCIKDNIYLRVTTTSSNFDAKSLTGEFTRLVLDKIN